MKVLSYNILEGGQNGLDKITRIIKTYSPDVLLLQEANTFLDHDQQNAKDFAQAVNMPYFAVAPSAEGYHVATFSRLPLKNVKVLEHFRNAALQVMISNELGDVEVFNAHLSPYSEDDRIKETDYLLSLAKQNMNVIIGGDLNSLSIQDNYSPNVIEKFNESQMKKFTHEGQLRFDVTNTFMAAGLVDCGAEKKVNTVPTQANNDPAHQAKLRLDYFYISENLKNRVKDFQVLKTAETDQASDHYPLLLTLI